MLSLAPFIIFKLILEETQMEKHENKIVDKSKQRIGWGVKTPSVNFEILVALVKEVGLRSGEHGTLDDLSIISGNSASSSTFVKKLRDLKNFGLINIDNKNYTLTGLGKRIAHPTSVENEKQALFESFVLIDNIKKIWEFYKGKRLPQKEFLANAIVSIIHVPIELKLEWADYFINGAKVVGLLHEIDSGSYQVLSGISNKTNFSDQSKTDNIGVPSKKEDLNGSETEKPISQRSAPETIITKSDRVFAGLQEDTGLRIQKPISGGKTVLILVPEGLTKHDVEKIKSLLKSVEAALEGLLVEEKENE